MIEKNIPRKPRGAPRDLEKVSLITDTLKQMEVGDSFVGHEPRKLSWEAGGPGHAWSKYHVNRCAKDLGIRVSYDNFEDESLRGYYRAFREA